MPFTGDWNDEGARKRYIEQTNMGIGDQLSQLNLYDPAVLAQLRTILGPYFEISMQNLRRAQDTSLTSASRGAGAYASAHGITNPAALLNRARGGVYSSFAPQFGELQQNQLGQLLNAGVNSQQFRAGNLMNQANVNQGVYGNWLKNDELDAQKFNFFRDVLPGLLNFGGKVGMAALFPKNSGGGNSGSPYENSWEYQG